MFESLQPQKADAILSLMAAYRADTNPRKVDLGVGVYKTESGETPVLSSVKQAEQWLLEHQSSKAYVGPSGSARFNQLMLDNVFGAKHPARQADRLAAVQAPGGCGALRLGAELIKSCTPDATVWVSNPTWANHIPLIGETGLQIREYPYYDGANKTIDFDGMMETLSGIKAGDVVLIHGCCHNPCGADLSLDQWKSLTDVLRDKHAIPFVDVAYQGFGAGLEEDATGWRHLAANVDEMLLASSCSKNFGLYRERTGAIMVLAKTPQAASNSVDRLCTIGRASWSMPPDHGAAVVETILGSEELTRVWHADLAEMRDRINGLRREVSERIRAAGIEQDFSFIPREKGMFSFLGISPAQVQALIDRYSIYMVNSSRINVAGFNNDNLDYVVDALKDVLSD